jgi:lariat debranching enzyme
MWVALEGCLHGQLDCVYDSVRAAEANAGIKVSLLICCGDFQATRDNGIDLKSLACPPKFRQLNDFHKYYTGEAVAPVLTIFIGGNHEASNYMQQLPCGGWVAPNIYYMGYCGVVNVGGIRIGGLSGIFNSKHYRSPHYETCPYTPSTLRSVYHIREIDVFRLSLLSVPSGDLQADSGTKGTKSRRLDTFMSHDWPQGIALYGDVQQLVRKKSFLKSEIGDGSLGSPPAAYLLHLLQPEHWFSAHLHVKYAAVVRHGNSKAEETAAAVAKDAAPYCPGKSVVEEEKKVASKSNITRFLSLDKAIPGRKFLQLVHFGDEEEETKMNKLTEETEGMEESASTVATPVLRYDEEWLAILIATHHLWNATGKFNETTAAQMSTKIQEERRKLRNQPTEFFVPPKFQPSEKVGNVQMDEFLERLGLAHIITVSSTGDGGGGGGGSDIGLRTATTVVQNNDVPSPAIIPPAMTPPSMMPPTMLPPAMMPPAMMPPAMMPTNTILDDPDEIDLL